MRIRLDNKEMFSAVLLAVLLALGCGGDGDGDGGTGPDDDTVRIGLLTTLTGALGRQGPTHRAAAEMAVREINAAGGILGRDLEIVVGDTETDPPQAVAAARALVDQGIAVIVGPVISSATLRVAQEVTIPGQVLLVSPASTSPEITALSDEGLVWRTAASDILKAQVSAQLAFDLGARSIGVVYIDNSFGRGLAAEFAQRFIALGGEALNSSAYPELTSSEIESYDYRIHVDQAMEGRPDLIYLITFIEDGAKIAIAADSHLSEAYQPFFLAEIPPSSGALADIGVYEGLYGVEQESPTTSNQLLFRERYIELFDTEPDLFADAVYDGVYLIALAMEQAGTTLATAVAGQLRAVSAGGTVVNVGEFARGVELVRQGDEIDYEGASGSIDFDAFGDVSSATYRIWKVENGQFVDLETVTVP